LTGVAALAAVSVAFPAARTALWSVVGAYAVAALVASLSISLRQGLGFVGVLPLVFMSYHLAYALGTAAGLASAFFAHVGAGRRAPAAVSRTG
jgi:hypothetical protein